MGGGGSSLLSAEGIQLTFGSRRILRGVDLELRAGETTCLFGPNGAGKTSLLRILAGLLRPEDGETRVRGAESVPDRRRAVGYLGHRLHLYPHLTGRENLAFHAVLHDLPHRDAAVERWLEAVGLAKAADSLVRTYSRGMCQRLSLARALLHEPQILLLDEPHSGLDPDGVAILEELLEAARDGGAALLVASHDLERGDLADEVLVLCGGRIRWSGRGRELPAGAVGEAYRRTVEGVLPGERAR